MEKMNDLRALLKHEIQDLYSAEEQIIKAMPAMIEKAKNPELKKALKDHLRITEQQKKRLDQVRQHLESPQEMADMNEDKGLFSRLMNRRQVCKGMEGILKEGDNIMSEDMNADVMDAAILASAQKVEHYEICGYGTVKAYARELGLTEVENLLDQTLQEEYQADKMLTQMAVSRVNREAESTSGSRGRTAAAGQSGTTARSEGGRATSREKARINEPEMEMARGSRTSGSTGRSQGASGTTAGRSTGSSSRTGTTGASSTDRGDTSSRITSSRSTSGTSGASRGTTKAAGRTTGSTGNKGTNTRGGSNRTR